MTLRPRLPGPNDFGRLTPGNYLLDLCRWCRRQLVPVVTERWGVFAKCPHCDWPN